MLNRSIHLIPEKSPEARQPSLLTFIDGLPAARQGDPLTPHAKPKHPPHPRKIARGSSTVFIDGLPAARTGDAIDCGGVVIGGGTVNIG
ncbi:PAAR domain-containing protein [Escherichia coli]|uniref:PAAR domain-containing protein n=1 Tax=Escherichia coli TaxID=562 RepID=UPI003B9ACED5